MCVNVTARIMLQIDLEVTSLVRKEYLILCTKRPIENGMLATAELRLLTWNVKWKADWAVSMLEETSGRIDLFQRIRVIREILCMVTCRECMRFEG